jgi:hypothetical protein
VLFAALPLRAAHPILGVGRKGPGPVDLETACVANRCAGSGADEVNGVLGARREGCLADQEGDVVAEVGLVLVVRAAGDQAHIQWRALPFRRHGERGNVQGRAGLAGDADRVAGLGADVRHRHVEFLIERIRRFGVVRHRNAGLLVVREHAHVVASVLLRLDVA